MGRVVRRRRLIITVTAVMAVSTLMQYSLSAIGPLVIDSLALSSVVYGSFFTVYFAVCTVGSLILGGPTDRMGARWGMALVGVTASIGFVAVAAAPSVGLVYVGLFFSGLAGAFCNPATNLALLNIPNRGPLVGIKQSGVQMSAIVGGSVVAPAAQEMGWRGAFLVCAAVSLAVTIPVSRVRLGDAKEAAVGEHGNETSIVGLGVYAFLMGCGLATTVAYLPLYATEDLGLSAQTGGYLIGIFGVCAVVGRISWGYLSHRSARFARPRYSLGIMAAGALGATAMLGVAGTGAVALVFVGTIAMGLTGAAWNGIVMNSVMTSANAGTSGRAAGRVQAAFFGGLCLSPLAFGIVVDRSGSYAFAWAGTAAVYVLAWIITQTLVNSRRARTGAQLAPRRCAGC